eukprot:285149_1
MSVGDKDELTAREFVLGASQSLESRRQIAVLCAKGEDRLADFHSRNGTACLTESVTHTGLKTISTGTRKHFIDTEDVVGVETHAHVKRVLAGGGGHVLVDGNTASLQRLTGDLLLLVGHQVDTQWELVNGGLLVSNVVDSDLGVRDTSAVP